MHLIIPDTHNYHGDDRSRIGYLATYISQIKPEVIIIMGDWFDMNSINRFDKTGSLKKEGEKVALDLKAGLNALSDLLKPIRELNQELQSKKKKQYKPRIIFTEGNHEIRLSKFIDQNPVLEGLLTPIEELMTENPYLPIEYIRYGDFIEVGKILYTHILFNGGRPISGRVNTCGDALRLVDKSVIFCHTHRLEFKQFKRMGSNKLITALNGGCFLENEPEYMYGSHPNWWSGIVKVYPDGKGNFDIETVSLQTLRNFYG